MPTSYTGNPANGAWSPAIGITEPADGDTANAASVDNNALQKLADFVAFLQANAGQLGNANTWTGTQLMNAAVTITALLTLSANNVTLTAGVLQSILKGGTGKLQVGTSQASDFELLANNVVRFAALAAGGLDAKSNRLSNLATPTTAGDALVYPLTRPQIAALGQQVSSSSGAFVTASTTYVSVTNLSVTLTTSGRPAMLLIFPDGGSTPAILGSLTGGKNAYVTFARGGTPIAQWALGGSGSTVQVGSLIHFDQVGAGTYTYTIQAKADTGGSAGVENLVLVAYEIG